MTCVREMGGGGFIVGTWWRLCCSGGCAGRCSSVCEKKGGCWSAVTVSVACACKHGGRGWNLTSTLYLAHQRHTLDEADSLPRSHDLAAIPACLSTRPLSFHSCAALPPTHSCPPQVPFHKPFNPRTHVHGCMRTQTITHTHTHTPFSGVLPQAVQPHPRGDVSGALLQRCGGVL